MRLFALGSRLTTRSASAALAVASVVIPLSIAAATPAAADGTAIRVVGPSDLSDSHLVQDVLAPGFAAAYPQYTLNYTANTSGGIVADAESGAADAVIMDAESEETQFVQSRAGLPNRSYEPAGRAIFYGDYVLLGSLLDPAGIFTNYPHDLAGAFARIATAGEDNLADFVSRGGTPDTTVNEHKIWELFAEHDGTSRVPGLTLCKVSDDDGGGYSPSTTDGFCPNTITYPSWYHATGLNEAANVTAADLCGFGNANRLGHNDCYVLTDRGTFDYLQSMHVLKGTQIVSRDNDVTGLGGATTLTNYFHAYAVNPPSVPASSNINLAGAKAFLDYLTSPAAQTAITGYLANVPGDSAPPFTGDAAPKITTTAPDRKVVQTGYKLTIFGQISNVAPATPPLAGQPVRLARNDNGAAVPVTSGFTDSEGRYKLSFEPKVGGAYRVMTGSLTQVENDEIIPAFSDVLAPGAGRIFYILLKSHPRILKAYARGSLLTVRGSLHPLSLTATGKLTLLIKAPGAASYEAVVTKQMPQGAKTFLLNAHLARRGTYLVAVRYAIPHQAATATTAPVAVRRK